MADILVKSIIWFLVVFAIIQILVNIYKYFYTIKRNDNKNKGIYIIVTVKNQQETVEGIIRSIVWRSLNKSYYGVVPNILIVDMGSTDDTLKILEKLHNEYEFIKVTDKEEYINIIEKMVE